MLTLTFTILNQVADKARSDAAAHPRWLSAITRALIELENNPWIDRNPQGHGLIIASPSGQIYTANGVCQCTAFLHSQACWHRAAARLVRLHDAALERQQHVICQQPDNLCEVHNPCPEHAPQAAAYLAEEAHPATLRDLGQRLAAARATALLNEVFA